MGEASKIEWTHHTFNPWWGCMRVSPGCERCYAETFAKRVGLKLWGPTVNRRTFGDKHWSEPLKWDRAAAKAGERHRVFCASMADVFEDRVDLDEERARLWALIERTPHLDWLLLTKRPENAHRMVPWTAIWPNNVWFGATAESTEWLAQRAPWVMRAPARVRFLSCEPLLNALDLDEYLSPTSGINWVIVGGESGPGARPFDPAWASGIVEQCRYYGVPVHVKQMGARPVGMKLRDSKGGDWTEWPERLRVRQYPLAEGDGGGR